MYKAKERGRNCFDFFSNEMRVEYYENLELELELKEALKTNKFYLHYQPIVDMRNNKIVGMEALLRLKESPKLGVVPPSVFIPVAEKLTLIQDIGLWAFDTACSDIRKWTEKGIKELFYSINVSPKQVNMENFNRNFKSVISKYAVDPKLIELEVTEIMFGGDFDSYIDKWLENFKELNLKLSIDDFGTGYSSLSRIGILPISTIKIDGSFIRNIGKSEKNNAVIKNIIHLSESLPAKTIAECVETKEQIDFLLENGCNLAQGFYYYKSMPVDEITEILCNINK
jgi:EAL domain-containing protein (putative c-di-GMP-specific phosphodiesterase class I)